MGDDPHRPRRPAFPRKLRSRVPHVLLESQPGAPVSLEQLRRAIAIKAPMTSPQWAVLMVLADCANDHGLQCFPSQETISRVSRLKIRTVRNALRALLDAGHIEQIRPGSGALSASYKLNLPPASRAAPPAPLASPSPAPLAGGSGTEGALPRHGPPFTPAPRAANPSESPRNLKDADAAGRATPAGAPAREPGLHRANGHARPPTDPAVIELRRRQAASIAAALASGSSPAQAMALAAGSTGKGGDYHRSAGATAAQPDAERTTAQVSAKTDGSDEQ
jgi:hypothetical protein